MDIMRSRGIFKESLISTPGGVRKVGRGYGTRAPASPTHAYLLKMPFYCSHCKDFDEKHTALTHRCAVPNIPNIPNVPNRCPPVAATSAVLQTVSESSKKRSTGLSKTPPTTKPESVLTASQRSTNWKLANQRKYREYQREYMRKRRGTDLPRVSESMPRPAVQDVPGVQVVGEDSRAQE
jgi:hypothetical protein